MSEHMQFQTETSRLLDIVANALYTEREIFLRELVSNAADACDRLRYDAISNPGLAAGDTDYAIDITFDTDARLIKVSDNGIGMNREDLIKNLGTIAHSGTRTLVQELGDGARKDLNLIGQFGVGFYSAFMVASKVEVRSRKAGDDMGWLWVSDGKGAFVIDEALKDARGTEITLHIKDEAAEFLIEERLKSIVKKYSDHIGVPVRIMGKAVNAGGALWMRAKSDVTPEQYTEFYRSVSGGLKLDEPWMTLHWHAEGAFEYHNLLFIPVMKPFDLYDPRRHHGVKLYVRRVFITDGAQGLLPPFLRFVKGVVDSEDLPLNISREMLQANPVIAKMSAAITRKILSELEAKASADPEAFAQFWAQFGPVIKEGLYDAHNYREQLTKVARFYSTKSKALTSLEDYVSRMQDGQEHIYYLSAPNPEAAGNSPQLEAFRAKNVEVLFMTDAIDEFWLPIQADFKGKKFKSITRGSSELSQIKSGDTETPPTDTETGATEKLLARLREVLLLEVKDVAVSERLVDSPVCLVAPENDVDINMQRILKKQQTSEGMTAQHILEINMKHPLIVKLRLLVANDSPDAVETVKDTAFLLLDQARIVEGEPLRHPADFVRRMTAAMEKGLLG
jgi:molecular chaperone HtpG